MRKGETMKIVGMDVILMPVLEQNCMELIEQQRHGSRIEGQAQTRWEQTRDIDGSRLEGEELGQNTENSLCLSPLDTTPKGDQPSKSLIQSILIGELQCSLA